MRVTKTLVIGLGSTGTEICETVARRIAWELGSIERAPWVQFLCIETDGNNRPDIIAYEDFIPLTISAEQYRMLLDHPDAFDEKIGCTTWADMETLKKLSDGHVTAGAGNIRMVGRLAFFFPDNYEKIHSAVVQRLSELRSLTVVDAQESYGETPDGQKPDIQFANNRHLVIYVVGTLCGGTCSGLASDFGFFLNRNAEQSEQKVGIFTLPHQNLTAAIQKHAARYKRNAYAALVELNQYHLTDMLNGTSIRFPDGAEVKCTTTPYDLLFITAPRQVGTEFNQRLNTAIADYIFLNTFVPSTLPFAAAVDAPIMDRENQAHVFCSFGLSTVEFPAQRVIEACTYRLSAYALRQWSRRSVDQDRVEDWLDGLGLTWEGFKTLLFIGDKDIREESIKPLLKDAMKKVWRRTDDARRIISGSLRPLFQSSDLSNDGDPLSPGSLYRAAMGKRQAVAKEILDRVKKRIQSFFGNYYMGPAVVQQFLTALEQRLDELDEVASTLGEIPNEVDRTLRNLEIYRSSWLNRTLGRNKVRILIGHLRKALDDEVVRREDLVVAQALTDRTSDTGISDPGVLSQIRREVTLYRKRIINLRDRLVTWENRISQQSSQLASEEPNINGVLLFDPEAGGQGTVPEEFRRCLELDAGQTGITWEQRREEIATRIVRDVLSSLSESVTLPSTTPREEDLLIEPLQVDEPATWLPPGIRESVYERARAPFLRLRNEDVLERWQNAARRIGPEAMVEQAANMASSFLDLSETHATQGGRTPIKRTRLLLVPESRHKQNFLTIARINFAGHTQDSSPDRWRVVFVQNQFRFPLRGVLSVVGPGGISRATCDDFPTFFTRKDIAWVGVTDEENRRIRQAEEVLTISTLLEIVQPHGGALVFNWTTGPGDPGIRRLPLSFRHGAMALARGEKDLFGFRLDGALEVLKARIGTQRAEFKKSGGDVAFIQHLDKQLKQNVGGVVPDWNLAWLAERFVRYCAQDEELWIAYGQVYPPDKDKILLMVFEPGDVLPGNAGVCKEKGIYCTICGGWIGKDEQEAAQNGWRCFVNPQHYFGN
jgi:hypothetical protein